MKKHGLSIIQKRFLEYNLKDTFKHQPKFIELVDKLLSFGGLMVVAPPYEEDLEKILSRGIIFNGRRNLLIKGRVSKCHENAAVLWDKNQSMLKLVTGYALTADDNLWRQHSWCFRKADGRIIETTSKRHKYYGYVLTDDEANEFYRNYAKKTHG